jgi:polyribonucleotide nucleotidyltransferase
MYYLYITKQSNIMTTQITTQKMNFIGNNEVKGWFKLTDGTKTNFHIQENGEVQQWGNSNNDEVHPIVIGLLEMLFSQE